MENDVLIFEYDKNLKGLCLECNNKTQPKVVFIEQLDYPMMERRVWKEEEAEKDSRWRSWINYFSVLPRRY